MHGGRSAVKLNAAHGQEPRRPFGAQGKQECLCYIKRLHKKALRCDVRHATEGKLDRCSYSLGPATVALAEKAAPVLGDGGREFRALFSGPDPRSARNLLQDRILERL